MSPSQLSRVSAYVSRAVHFCPDMSARQALLFAGLLMGPAERSSNDVKRRTRSLLEELNLGGVRHAKVSQLSESQLRRLHIAVHLLLDTQLLILDQPLQGKFFCSRFDSNLSIVNFCTLDKYGLLFESRIQITNQCK